MAVWSVSLRPKLNEITGQDEAKGFISDCLSTGGDIPHLLFHGPAGVGKTSMAYALSAEMEQPLHIFNASSKDTRGIEFIERDVTPIARSGVNAIIVLDEADQITKSAQMALKGVLENCSCVFVLTSNNPTGIIEPLKSRCISFSFRPIGDADAKQALINTLYKTDFILTKDVPNFILDNIITSHKGDLRAMVNALQAYVTIAKKQGDTEALKFVETTLNDHVFDNDKFYSYLNDKDFSSAYKMMYDFGRLRIVLKEIMRHSIDNDADMRVVSHVVTAFRDLQFGMPEDVVVAGFCKNMVQTTPLYA